MKKAKNIIILTAVLGVTAITAPAWSTTVHSTIAESTIFKKIVDVRSGIKNKTGKVVINDDLHIKGNLIVDNAATVATTITADDLVGVQIEADDVVLDNDNADSTEDSYIESETLEDALDDELAVDLTTLLPNTTWTIENLTSDTAYDSYTGQVTFADTTLTIDSGRFAAADLVDSTVTGCPQPSSDITYRVVGPNIIYAAWESYGNPRSAVMTAFATDKNSISLVGSRGSVSGCGESGLNRISILTKVES